VIKIILKFTAILLLIITFNVFAENNIVHIEGKVFVNEQPIDISYIFKANDKIQTFSNGFIKFTYENSAYSISKNSVFILPDNEEKSLGNLIQGFLIGAFKKGETKKINVRHGLLSIRGTGVAIESTHEHSSVCLCYGEIDLSTEQEDIQLSSQIKYHTLVHIDSTGDIYLPDLNSCKFNHWSKDNIELEGMLINPSPFTKGLAKFLN